MVKYTEKRYPIVLPAEVIPDTSLLGRVFNRKVVLPEVISHWRITRVYYFLGEKVDFHLNIDREAMNNMPNIGDYINYHFKATVDRYLKCKNTGESGAKR